MQLADYSLEGRLLGCILVNPASWAEVAANFRPELFTDEAYQEIAKIIIELAHEGKKISSVAAMREAERRNIGLTTEDFRNLIDLVITPAEAPALLNELTDLYKRRTAYTTLAATMDKLRTEELPTDQVIAEVQQAMIQAFSTAEAVELKTMHEVALEMFEAQRRIQEGELVPVYPLAPVSVQTLVGGIEKGSLTIIAGRPSMGKTAFALNQVLFWAQKGWPGMIFSLEQKSTQIARRMLANLQGIPVSYMRQKLDEKHLDKFNTGLTDLSKLSVTICDRQGLTVDQICSMVRLAKMQNANLHWVMIDYLTLIQFDRRMKDHVALGDICLKLRNLAKELDIWVLLLSQLNRGVESRDNKRPILSDLRDSGNIEEYADVVLFLYREAYYNPEIVQVLKFPEAAGITEIILAKHREGGGDSQKALLWFNKPYMRWIDCPSQWSEPYNAILKQVYRKKRGRE